MNFYTLYQDFLSKEYPSTKQIFKNESWRNIIFPEILGIPKETVTLIKKTVEEVYHLKKQNFYLQSLLDKVPDPDYLNHPQDSVLMSFDFHLDSKGTPRLIEVNTNSSGFLIGNSLYQYHGLEYKDALKDLARSFQEEWIKFKGNSKAPPPLRIGIIDENPLSQKMFIEFLMYQDFFKTFEWRGEIYNTSSLKQGEENRLKDQNNNVIDFCYNRSTDFYLKNNPHLKEIYKKRKCGFSPHPAEYFLFSDKNRLCEWSGNQWPALKKVQKVFLNTWKLAPDNQDEAWIDRKKYVFKLAGKYGGKGVYRGKNLTSKTFKMLCKNQTVFQDYLPPALWKDTKGNQWKFDLRAFSYGKNVQQIIARCYKGQLTNFKTPGGGMASVTVEESLDKITNLTLPSPL